MNSLEEMIDGKIGEVRTESLDLSFGEIINLHSASPKELIIDSEYQRLFRWSDEQKSRLIESILLELPIPQIFVIERESGELELIDGLQRVSSVIQFIEPSLLTINNEPMPPLILQGCYLIRDLNNKKFEDLSLRLKLRIKRSSVRTVIIKKQSKSFLRYEMFIRLHTGGEELAAQEIRNCLARMVGEDGINFYTFLQSKASYPAFANCIGTISQIDKDKKGDEELVLRFLAAKNSRELFRGSVKDWLDDYMEKILKEEIHFDYSQETREFNNLFDFIDRILGDGAFVKYRGDRPIGGLAPAYYEAITVGTFNALPQIYNVERELVKRKIIETVQTQDFRDNTGSGANKKEKLEGRIKVIQDALLGLANE